MVRVSRPHTTREFRVSLSDRLTDAVLVSPDDPLPPLRRAATPAPNDPPPTPPEPADFWASDIAAQLAADRQQIEGVLAAVRSAAADLRQQHTDRLREWQRAAVELALTLAAKLLHERVTADEFPIEQIIRGMAGELLDDEIITVRLNPKDIELLERRLGGEPLLPGGADPHLVADPTLARTECRLEGRSSVSLSDLPRQLTQIRDDLLRSLTHARP